ncbi:GDSL esterase/lipase At5g03600-like [Selaginella moellendorffii]|uniref:GDSL esterase/lipase At5g03600-like n=1 Tax=Selaginella moellendorffii TaxID=88036 RepID=UPI000D1C45CB|nr:GDSL esterase/lipase At5g03600-like [Selaginella moellendorffii]|eukprot:XP_024542850.1 GDSL esterase/lipase At5g03600-like [Selaginella moellendorffii]
MPGVFQAFALILLGIFTVKLPTAQEIQCNGDVCSPLCVSLPLPKQSCFEKLYVFGNSLEDMGNLARDTSLFLPPFPYGITNPGCPKGRFSNGGIITDYFGSVLGLLYFQSRNLRTIVNVSFDNETRWFNSYTERCESGKSARVAALVGGGGNDYNIQDGANRSLSEIMRTVPDVVRKVVDTVKVTSFKF